MLLDDDLLDLGVSDLLLNHRLNILNLLLHDHRLNVLLHHPLDLHLLDLDWLGVDLLDADLRLTIRAMTLHTSRYECQSKESSKKSKR